MELCGDFSSLNSYGCGDFCLYLRQCRCCRLLLVTFIASLRVANGLVQDGGNFEQFLHSVPAIAKTIFMKSFSRNAEASKNS